MISQEKSLKLLENRVIEARKDLDKANTSKEYFRALNRFSMALDTYSQESNKIYKPLSNTILYGRRD